MTNGAKWGANFDQPLFPPNDSSPTPLSDDGKAETAARIRKEARKLRKDLLVEYSIVDLGGKEIVERAVESFLRMREAQALVDVQGLVFVNRFHEIKENPAAAAERKFRAAYLLALKQLAIDIEAEPLTGGSRKPLGR